MKMYRHDDENKPKKIKKDKVRIFKGINFTKISVDGKEIWFPSVEYVKELEARFYNQEDEIRNLTNRLRQLESRIYTR